MEEIITQFAGLGAVGVIAGVLFKKLIDDSNNDKEYFRAEIKETRELYKEELEKNREEIQKDREVYINSIDKLTNRLDVVEDTVKEIKDKIDREI